ncbi:hypothetical protein [Halobacillus sp. Marseille-P3879]|uniref:hypothetical protein n=1 Tax=Halobacillus TaxID=45667 RepID=UPI000C7D2632|nr:hypothetical protein [Halobacillus sp. Marseille-P3879]
MINFSIVDIVSSWFDEDLLQIFGLDPWYLLFGLVFLLMTGMMWVVKAVVEWMTVKNWITLLSYINCILIGFLILQTVDHSFSATQSSVLPVYYWSVSLLAISAYGLLLVMVRSIRTMARLIRKKSKKAA